LYVDLGDNESKFKRIIIRFVQEYTSHNFSISVSNITNSWTLIYSFERSAGVEEIINLDSEICGCYVKFLFNSGPGKKIRINSLEVSNYLFLM
jgi:hypothetical protein